MRIAMLSPEIAPFAKTGGLADVVGTLSVALERHGHELCLIMPAYRCALQGDLALEETGIAVSTTIAGRPQPATVLKAKVGRQATVYLVRADRYYNREFLYGTAEQDYSDNAERFVFFSRAALEILRRQPVDVLHCHDWQSAPAIVFLKAQPERYAGLASLRTVFTIHNLGFQGSFREADWNLLDLDRGFFTPQYLEFYGNINLVKGAVILADKITTVSPTYAREIIETEQGFGLDGVLRQRAGDVVGILNGVDYQIWNPESDPLIAERYTARCLGGKAVCKADLLSALHLPQEPRVPLIGMISRLTSQKGFDLVETVLGNLMKRRLRVVLLGNGEQRYEQRFTRAAADFPDRFAARIGFDNNLAHRIEAGADMFLMPSLYEPCGLNQMFSLKYGTIPIVRAIGGLKDTVEDYRADGPRGTGFVFGPYAPAALLAAVDRALLVFEDATAWTGLQRRAMSMDFSWDRSSQAYSRLYQELLNS